MLGQQGRFSHIQIPLANTGLVGSTDSGLPLIPVCQSWSNIGPTFTRWCKADCSPNTGRVDLNVAERLAQCSTYTGPTVDLKKVEILSDLLAQHWPKFNQHFANRANSLSAIFIHIANSGLLLGCMIGILLSAFKYT